MGSIIGHRIDYNGVGALRSQRHISSKKLIKYPPSPRSTHRSAGGVDKTKLGNAISPVKILSLQPSILLFLSDVSGVTSPKDMHSKKAGLINGRPSTFTTNYSGGGGGYFLLIGLWVCASGRDRFFTDGLTIIGLHFHESC